MTTIRTTYSPQLELILARTYCVIREHEHLVSSKVSSFKKLFSDDVEEEGTADVALRNSSSGVDTHLADTHVHFAMNTLEQLWWLLTQDVRFYQPLI